MAAGFLGAITILAVPCLSRIDLHHPVRALHEVLGVVVTVAVHCWRHNLVLSILVGTTTCVVLANGGVPTLT